MNELTKRILVALVGIPILVAGTFFGSWYFFVIIAIISALAQWEFYQIQKRKNIQPQNFTGIIIGLFILFGIETGHWLITGSVLIMALMGIMTMEMFRQHKNVSANIGVTLLGIFYIPLFLGTLLYLRTQTDQLFPAISHAGFKLIVVMFVGIWLCDTFAYSFGSMLGKRKLFQKVSPNKTWAGAIAGVIGSLLILFLAKILNVIPFGWPVTIAIGLIIGIIGQTGDLVESWFKRDADIKDSSQLLPGHGGMLDRFDSILFVSPAVFLLINLAYIWPIN
jgi:phosphatidate cytidylyltransferase